VSHARRNLVSCMLDMPGSMCAGDCRHIAFSTLAFICYPNTLSYLLFPNRPDRFRAVATWGSYQPYQVGLLPKERRLLRTWLARHDTQTQKNTHHQRDCWCRALCVCSLSCNTQTHAHTASERLQCVRVVYLLCAYARLRVCVVCMCVCTRTCAPLMSNMRREHSLELGLHSYCKYSELCEQTLVGPDRAAHASNPATQTFCRRNECSRISAILVLRSRYLVLSCSVG